MTRRPSHNNRWRIPVAAVLGVLLGACATPTDRASTATEVYVPETGGTGTAAATPASPVRHAAATPPSNPEPINPAASVFFGKGSASLDDKALKTIRAHAEQLVADRKLNVLLIGHADDLGSREYSVAFAAKRTTQVAAELQRLGVRPGQIRTRPRGNESSIRRNCADEACAMALSRVEIRVLKNRKNP